MNEAELLSTMGFVWTIKCTADQLIGSDLVSKSKRSLHLGVFPFSFTGNVLCDRFNFNNGVYLKVMIFSVVLVCYRRQLFKFRGKVAPFMIEPFRRNLNDRRKGKYDPIRSRPTSQVSYLAQEKEQCQVDTVDA